MTKIKKILCLLFLLSLFNQTYSQITIGNIEKVKDTVLLKPVPYDSLNNFKAQSKLIDYEQYIRLKIYLPPFENPKIGIYTGRDELFLFTKNPTTITLKDTIKLSKYDYSGVSGQYESILTDAAMNACPSGWHLPNEYEIEEMWVQSNEDNNVFDCLTNELAGYYNSYWGLYGVGEDSYFWSSHTVLYSGVRIIILGSQGAYTFGDGSDGLSVRCIKD